MKLPFLDSLAALALPLSVMAIEPGPSSPQQAATENWLALQVSGQAASTTPQAASATERDLAAQRVHGPCWHGQAVGACRGERGLQQRQGVEARSQHHQLGLGQRLARRVQHLPN